MIQDIRNGIKSSFLYKRFAYNSEGFAALIKFLQDEDIFDKFCEEFDFNKSNVERVFTLSMKELVDKEFVGLHYSDTYIAENLWENTQDEIDYAVADSVPPHGVSVFRIRNK